MQTPNQLKQMYCARTIHGVNGRQTISVNGYMSGEPRKKKFNGAALADLSRFLFREYPYNKGRRGADGHTFDDKVGLTAWGVMGWSYYLPLLHVNISWYHISQAFYGKGSPETIEKVLRVIDYYLARADVKLSKVYWNSIPPLQEYTNYYLGLDCNGFTGAYLARNHPGLGISGSDHINNLRAKLAARGDLSEAAMGDTLVREGAGGTRHVAMINAVNGHVAAGARTASVSITQSASSKGGLDTRDFTLTDQGGNLRWKTSPAGYEFELILAPKRK